MLESIALVVYVVSSPEMENETEQQQDCASANLLLLQDRNIYRR